MPVRRFCYDCEFLEDGRTIALISVGYVSVDDNREFYAIDRSFRLERLLGEPWLLDNVVPHLPIRTVRSHPDGTPAELAWDHQHPEFSAVMPRDQIAVEILKFLEPSADGELQVYADCGAYDHVAVSQLYGRMIQLPKGMPHKTREVDQLWEDSGKPAKPPKPARPHHALDDAREEAQLVRACFAARAALLAA